MAVERIQPDGLAVPPTYTHVVKVGNTIYIAGQVAQDERGQLVGAGDFVAQANQVFGNLGKALRAAGADFRNLVKITVFVNAVPGFSEHPEIANGASDLFVAVFGEQGRHARVAVGAGSLPRNVAVEVDAVFEVA